MLLAALLEEAGVDPKATWFVAQGADAPHLTRSVPLSKAFHDAIVAPYQNGERLMPGNGYPMRLFVPGWEGNMNVKYLRRINVTDGPALTYHEAHTYTDPLPDGKSFHFYFLPEVKSFITNPSPGTRPKAPGYVEISGVAYSGTGRIAKVMVSVDGGTSLGRGRALGNLFGPTSGTRATIIRHDPIWVSMLISAAQARNFMNWRHFLMQPTTWRRYLVRSRIIYAPGNGKSSLFAL